MRKGTTVQPEYGLVKLPLTAYKRWVIVRKTGSLVAENVTTYDVVTEPDVWGMTAWRLREIQKGRHPYPVIAKKKGRWPAD